jgi:hypothetical protein
MVARAAARSHGQRQADGIGVESRSTGNQDASPGALGRSPVGARQEACRGASVPTRAAPSCRPGRHPAAGELPARTDRDRPRSFRRPSIGHPLRHTRCADLSDLNPGRDRRGARTQDARGSLRLSTKRCSPVIESQIEIVSNSARKIWARALAMCRTSAGAAPGAVSTFFGGTSSGTVTTVFWPFANCPRST